MAVIVVDFSYGKESVMRRESLVEYALMREVGDIVPGTSISL
jgi:hypothetical protein